MTVLKKKGTTKINELATEERPTKLEIPNSNLGGDMDGMGDLDNAPMPPMGADDMGGEDPMGSPNDMGGEPPMNDMGEDPNGMENPDMGNGEDDELMDIINSLSIEDKAAVTKYAKSMADDSEGGEEPMGDMQDMGGNMSMESIRNYKHIIDEVVDSVLNDTDYRDEEKLPKAYRKLTNPYISPL